MGYTVILGAILGFFLSVFILMLLWGDGIVQDLGLENIGYKVAMLITVTSRLALAPLMVVAARRAGRGLFV
ncbi:hypothetical protein ACFLT8_01020 [Chloroflexota bacterium]